MKLFVSYARVDKPYCVQIIDTLSVHDVWYDQRLYAGQDWWKEILRRLDWCEGFVYLLSPESIKSPYCQREFELAQNLGRPVFPVFVTPNVEIPESLYGIQYVDLSKGLTAEAVKNLLNAIYIAETHQHPTSIYDTDPISSEMIRNPVMDPNTVISSAVSSMERGQFDQAVFLLKQAQEQGFQSRFFNIGDVLKEAELSLERQAYLREAEREYKQIAALVRHKSTMKLGCEAFKAFQKDFPGYDPDHLIVTCYENTQLNLSKTANTPYYIPKFSIPLLDWCIITPGYVNLRTVDSENTILTTSSYVDRFFISKYPITNAQFDQFIEDSEGYCSSQWWEFSEISLNYHSKSPAPKPNAFKGDERPREMITWYEAVAFCRWLSGQIDQEVLLPTTAQWQRAYQGDTERIFPWGNKFDRRACNTSESRLQMTTPVNRYSLNVSQFGVQDMAGNVWEWCIDLSTEGDLSTDIEMQGKRAIRGGSFISPAARATARFYYRLNPMVHYSSIGFRIATID